MKYAIALHGGAGTILKSLMTSEKESLYTSGLSQALAAGTEILAAGGTALDAVTATVVALEDNTLFNAGKGSVFNHEGGHDMDASIMCGAAVDAGAVAGVQGIKNPILLARKVLEASEHLLLSGKGAESFAALHQIEQAPECYFYDAFRHSQYQEALAHDRVQLDHTAGDGKKFGTVGAVALDNHGNLAAATSTGGLTNKKYGRIGDSPIVGAGTYANNNSVAVSCTGVGEMFIRESVAFQIHMLVQDAGKTLAEACNIVVQDRLIKIGGEGGIIAIDKDGNIELNFNSDGMYRAWANSNGVHQVAIYK